MATLKVLRVAWTGGPGLPGVSTFYTEGSADNLLNRIRTFFEAFKTAIPTPITLTYPSSGVTLDSVSGDVNGTWTAPGKASTVGTANTPYAPPVGLVFNWHTGFYVGGRELRGKTFLVPVAAAVFTPQGTITPADLTVYTARGNALVGTGEFADDPLAIYSRRNNATAPARSASCSPKAAVLRSRRD